MMQFLTNVKLWIVGFTRLEELDYKPGWSARSPMWFFLYIWDYGTHVLTGGAVVSWSRWFWENRHNRFCGFMTRLLNHIDPRHGEHAGPALWGSIECSGTVRLCVCAAWIVLFLVVT